MKEQNFDQTELVQAVKRSLNETGTTRRGFLAAVGLAGGGLVVASLGAPAALAAGDPDLTLVSSEELNAFIQVSPSGEITIYSANPEMGQGIKTALPMIIAEELGARWEDVRVLQSPVSEDRFGNQRAGGSTTIPRTWDQMRRMGASAREMFISAGALVMELPREELKTADSKVVHASGQNMTFGQLATLAAKQDVPDADDLTFKDKDEYTIIGTSVSGVDNLVISTGAALFGIDTRVPGMLYAAYQKCPTIGGLVKSANIDAIKAMPGVVDAFLVEGNGDPRELLDGVAIVGKNTHAVFSAKRQLKIEWDTTNASDDSWTGLVEEAKGLHGTRGDEEVIDKGDVEAAFTDPDNTVLDAFYEFPFVAHLCMEPMNCTAHYQEGEGFFDADTLEIWAPTQGPARVFQIAESMFGLDEDQVTVHQPRLGGSFGRRVYREFLAEAIEISKQVKAPVKLTWTREDDIRHDFFRTGGFQSVKGAVDKEGRLIAFEDHFMGMETDGNAVSGSRFAATQFPLLNVENAYASKTMFDIDTPCGPWRAPGSNTTAFVVQSFLDELAHAGGRDYLDFLVEAMGDPRWFDEGNIRSLNTGRAVAVIKLAAEKAGWGKTLPAGRGLGLAFCFSHAAHVAEVAEVSVDANKKITVHQVTVAVDVGPIINMSGALSQVEGAVVDGLSTMMGQKITFENGAVEQSNFHDYEVLRIEDSPKVNTHFIQSEYSPTGLGEPALPPLAPAVTNAIFAATGQRIRKMPLTDEGYSI
ncbi:MAG: molybdopterin-dependent oxidoreductase [Pseudomonadales bacterium]|nr:molybdopterin-dependent oxidoreductase [Pseudomonadales bacterium]